MERIIRAATISPVTHRLRGPVQRAVLTPAHTVPAVSAVSAVSYAPPTVPQQASIQEPANALLTDHSVPAAVSGNGRESEQELAEIRRLAEQRGLALGMEKAEEWARKAVQQPLERFAAIVVSLHQSRKTLMAEAEDTAVEVVYATLCRIIGDVAVSREAVTGMVNQTLNAFQERHGLIVRLNPQDLELLKKAAAESDLLAIDRTVELRADAAIRLGGCIVESSSGTLDARLETQLNAVRETLLQVRKSRENIEDGI